MSEERDPIGYDSGVLAGLLRDILTELREQNGKTVTRYTRLIGNLYWRHELREEH